MQKLNRLFVINQTSGTYKKLTGLLILIFLSMTPVFSQGPDISESDFGNAIVPSSTTVRNTVSNYTVKSVSNEFVKCPITIPNGHYVIAESFFGNFDYVVRRVANLQTHGFEEATYIHTSCQNTDVEKDLYVVIINKPASSKLPLYKEIQRAYQVAANHGIELISMQIIHVSE